MSGENTVSVLNGMFKQKYSDKLKDLIPDGVMLYNMIPFSKKSLLGDEYHMAVVLGTEHGFSYGGQSGSAFSLNAAVASQTQDAKVKGYEFVLRSRLSYGAVSRSVASEAAFESATKLVVANMVKSFAKRIEVQLFYGQSGLAAVDTATAVSGQVITIPAAEWAPGIWSGSVGMPIVQVDDSAPTSQAQLVVSAVNLEGRAITVTGSIGSYGPCKLYHKGAIEADGTTSNEFPGLHKIMTNTGSLFNINASTYDMWKSVEHSASSGALSFSKIQKAVAKGVEKGLDSDLICLINPKAWSDLLNDEAALRMYDSSFKSAKLEQGAQALTFHGQNGKIEIRPCNFVKEAHAFLITLDDLMRIGSTDVTFKLPGGNDQFFRQLEDTAGWELRAYSDQSLFCAAPARLILIGSIVNS